LAQIVKTTEEQTEEVELNINKDKTRGQETERKIIREGRVRNQGEGTGPRVKGHRLYSVLAVKSVVV
jgi:hypothetical protein